jgi:tetratricopeptide (TPR) repeat protein
VTSETRDLERWVRDLRLSDPFLATRAEAELVKAGSRAGPALLALLEDPDPVFRITAESLLDRILASFLVDLESEHRSLDLDLRELDLLEARQIGHRELQELRKSVEAWTQAWPELKPRAQQYRELKILEEKQRRLDLLGVFSSADRAEIDRLRTEVDAARAKEPAFEDRALKVLRLQVLEEAADSLKELGEVELLRLQDLKERVESRRPRAESLVEEIRRLGLPAYRALATRRERLPLQESRSDLDPRSANMVLYDRILAAGVEFLTTAAAPGQPPPLLPPPDRLEVLRYQLGPLWALVVDRKGPLEAEAGQLLNRHLESTVRDLSSEQPALRERAALELYRMGPRGASALAAKLSARDREQEVESKSPGDLAFLAHLLRWRIDPRTYSRVGIDFLDYEDLTFTGRRRKVFQYTRAAGEDAIPTLRAIVEDAGLEGSFLVKYAAAHALASQLGDRAGYVVLKARHPDLVLKLPEVSRDIILIQGMAHLRAKNYALAVAEFQRLVDEIPFDFEANYHLAFAYLLLKDYARSIHHFEIARRIQPKDQLTLYNLSCAYSLAGKVREALDALEAAVDAGFDDVAHMNADGDLDAIRSDPRFQTILKKAGKRR